MTEPEILENEDNSSTAAPSAPVAPVAPVFDPRRRMRELLSIPDRDRTDAEWDELNELEIQTAPGNRSSGQQPYSQPGGGKPGGGGGGFPSKNRSKNKGGPRKPGMGGGRPPMQGKPNKPRPPV